MGKNGGGGIKGKSTKKNSSGNASGAEKALKALNVVQTVSHVIKTALKLPLGIASKAMGAVKGVLGAATSTVGKVAGVATGAVDNVVGAVTGGKKKKDRQAPTKMSHPGSTHGMPTSLMQKYSEVASKYNISAKTAKQESKAQAEQGLKKDIMHPS